MLFSQFLPNIKAPFPSWSRSKGCYIARFPFFRLFPVILAIIISWLVCAIITAAGGFPDDPKHPNYLARTDARTIVLREAKWFRFPYPGQWGLPTVSAAGVFGMLAGVLASIIESVGDYYACARLSGALPPPKHAINRGIGIEGIGCFITGIWGTGNGTTSYSENIGAISITKVGSLRVLQYGGLVMVIAGVLGKVGALFTTIPDPIVGGVFIALFGIITAVGISNLQFVDLNSSRNIFIIGVALLMGLALPNYMENNKDAVDTGVPEIDQIITVLCKTGMAVGGLIAFVLDNTIPGTVEERGLTVWRKISGDASGDGTEKYASFRIYDLPFGLNRLSSFKFAKYVPFIPHYPKKEDKSTDEEAAEMVMNEMMMMMMMAVIVLLCQHYLTMLGANLAVPLALSEKMCFANNYLAISEVMSTVFFTSGLATILQTTFGLRLPIVQGSTFTFLAPAISILNLEKWKCPEINSTSNATIDMDAWKPRMREIQGAIIVSSLFQVLVGFSGLMGVLMRFIGPVSIAPTIILIGLALFEVAAFKAGTHWGISVMTIVLIVLFSQYLHKIRIPIPAYSKERGFYAGKYPIFRLFPIIMAICTSWIVSLIITAAGGFPDDKANPQYKARTDSRIEVLEQAEWFRVPYPGQWGLPTVSAAAVFGMVSGVIASVVESIGDYFACARMSGAPPPPTHAINRGIGMEGIGCIITGCWGTGSGTTSYSENIGAIGITKVGSLRVIQVAGCVAIVMGVVGKIGALFTTIPDPIVGGVFMVMFGMITAVGISNLQYVDMNSARNMFIVGVSIVFGMALPFYLKANQGAIKTGNDEVDQVLNILLTTNIAVGGLLALFLDNTIPGTEKERGMIGWKQHVKSDGEDDFETASIHVYDLPFCLKRLGHWPLSKFIPFLPYYPDISEDFATSATNVAVEMDSVNVAKRDVDIKESVPMDKAEEANKDVKDETKIDLKVPDSSVQIEKNEPTQDETADDKKPLQPSDESESDCKL
ncbi:hypothetical protein QZH41_008770 [Actinostola sp. cb2023]|nr:hypothetical protein QZH41_008770 [Actinostola sp. cb2023]